MQMEEKKKEPKEPKNKNNLLQIGLVLISAIIIFWILWTIIGVDPIYPAQDTLQELSNSIESANPSGQTFTGKLILNKNSPIEINDLAIKTDLDKESFFKKNFSKENI